MCCKKNLQCLSTELVFYRTPLKDCRGIVFTHCVQMGGQVCPGCISETLRCRKLIFGRGHWLGGVGVQCHG